MSSLASKLAALDRRVWVAVAVVLVLLIAAGGTAGFAVYQQSIPTTVALNLKSGVKEVKLDQPLVLSFSRPVDAAQLAAHFRISPNIDGKLEAQSGGTRFTWTSSGPWADLTRYTVSVDTFSDRGHQVRPGRWTFTTTILPRIIAVTTDQGAGLSDGAEVPIGTALQIVFNTAMDANATTIDANGAAAGVTWSSDGKTATLPTQGMRVGTLQLTLASGKDALGHVAAADWKLGLSLVFHLNIHTTALKYPALVQIPNDPSARDQSGLQAADLVYEYATEGGITRMTAIFTHAPDKIGPVRSGRLISIKLTQHYRGTLFLSGTSNGTFQVLRQSDISAFFDTPGYYYRSADRYPPNNLYINSDAVARVEATAGPAPETLPTGTPKLSGGEAAGTASVPIHNSTYSFDGGTGTYTKTEDGHLMADAGVGQPLRIALVVVLHTTVTTTGIIEDVNGAHGLDYDLSSGGKAEFYYQGAKYTGRWNSPAADQPLTFSTDSGQQVSLPAGLVWVDVVP